MEALLTSQFTYFNLLTTVVAIIVFYLAVKALEKILQRAALPSHILEPMRNTLRWILLFLEPAAALLLLVIFVFIRPGLHGPVVGLLLIGGFAHLRNYLSGHIVRFYENLTVGNRLRTTNAAGVVTNMGRLGLQLRTSEGMHFASYSRLLAEGFTMVTGEEAGGFFQLDIFPKEMTENNSKGGIKNNSKGGIKNNSSTRLHDLLTHAPYLSSRYNPDISQDLNTEGHFSTKILVDEERHLHELIALLDEQGWKTEVAH